MGNKPCSENLKGKNWNKLKQYETRADGEALNQGKDIFFLFAAS